MTTPRQNSAWTATILAIGLLAVGWWAWPSGYRAAIEPHPPAPPVIEPTIETAPPQPAPDTMPAPPLDRGVIGKAPTAASSTQPEVTTATVIVHVRFPDPVDYRAVQLRAIAEAGKRVVGASSCRRIDQPHESGACEAIGYLDVPANQWLHIEAAVEDKARSKQIHLPGRRLHLGPGERHHVELQLAGSPTTLRITGPSPLLAPHLRLQILDSGLQTSSDNRARPPAPFELPLAADASVTVYAHGPLQARALCSARREHGPESIVPLQTADGSHSFDPAPVVELTPREALLGIVARHRNQPVAAAVSLAEERPSRNLVTCHVTTRAEADGAATIQVTTAALGHQRGELSSHDRRGDLWTIDIDRLRALGELVVTFDDTEVTATVPPLVAMPHAGLATDSVALVNNRRALLPPGPYRLLWAPHGLSEDTALEFVRIEANATKEVVITPRSLDRWKIQLHEPPRDVAMQLRFAGRRSLGTSRNGWFEIDLGRVPRQGEAATIDSLDHLSSFPASFVRVDAAQREAVISATAMATADWTTLTAPSMRGGKTSIGLARSDDLPHLRGGLLGDGRVAIAPDTSRHGHVFEEINGQRQLTRWFEVTAGTNRMQLPPIGRWATVIFARPTRASTVTLEGPGQQSVRLPLQTSETLAPLFVPDGTTSITIRADGTIHVFEPTLADFVVR